MDYAKLVKSLREKYSWTQSEMAEKLGISQPTVSLIELGKTEPSKGVAEKLSKLSETGLSFGQRLLEQRTKMGLSRAELAKKAGISELAVYFIETGRTESPWKSTLEKLEKVLGKLPQEVHTEIKKEAEVPGLGEYLGPFPIEQWESNVGESSPGIYVFYDGLKRPVRLGQTDDIKRRLKEYARDAWWFRNPTVESFAYIIVKDERLRKSIEATMIKLVGDNAIFNIQHKI